MEKQGNNSGSNQYTDPTYNVLQLVNAAVGRLDDLQKLHIHYNDIIHKMNIESAKEAVEAESKRLDALRQVDAHNLTLATTRQDQAATLLAKQLFENAEVLRNLVASTATAMATQMRDVNEGFNKRLIFLEESHYKAQGAGLPEEAMKRIATLEVSKSEKHGKDEGYTKLIGWILFAISVLGFLLKNVKFI